MPLWFPLAFMAAPVVLLVLLVLLARFFRREIRNARTVPAGWVRSPMPGLVTAENTWITRSNSLEQGSGAFVRQPIVSYRPAAGGAVTFTSPVHGTFMPKPGASVGVVHDPADPSRARIAPESIPKTFQRFSTVVFVVMALILVPLGAIFELVGWFLLTHR